MREKFARFLTLFLPGIFLLGFNIGTGSVTAMAKAGATYGMSLLWTIVASCFATYFMICVYGKFTLVTGQTALQAFRNPDCSLSEPPWSKKRAGRSMTSRNNATMPSFP